MRSAIFLLVLFAITARLDGQSQDINSFIDSYARDNKFSGTILIKK